ncbi:receptor-like protein 46 [Mercurialis annua]|uniref:receptor-like protein 46 n=1 Tax=Mercurialis annua TaxID=3986 RepID=UPI002160DA69|nr:receptor-like protein 46 [Mercurialis annua]
MSSFPWSVKLLQLSRNHFSSFLPQNLSNFRQLQYLDLHDNNFTGEIPKFVRDLSFIQILNLRRNTTISSASTFLRSWNSSDISSCCQWERVYCDSQQVITDLQLENITQLVAYGSVVTSDVLTSLFHLKTLTSLTISYNDMHGQIPRAGFANLTNLVFLYMHENCFTGSIPQLFSLRNLETLDLTNNLLHGTLNLNFGAVSNLRWLSFSLNLLRGDPVKLGNLTSLELLSLGDNKFSGEIPSSLFGLKELNFLDLRRNSFSTEIPMEIGNFSKMVVLLLGQNNFQGKIPASIQKMKNLEILDLQDNFLSGDIPTWLFDFKNMIDLILGGNRLSLGNKTIRPKSSNSLSLLSLRSCNLSGQVPIWISNLARLNFLDLSHNNLTGNFPQWLAEKQLCYLILSSNKFSGSLPPLLFQSEQLYVLVASNNNFSGLLPETVGKAVELIMLMMSSYWTCQATKFSSNEFPIFNQTSPVAYIDLSFNNLSGEVPVTFPLNVKLLQLSRNHFPGFLPQNLSNFRRLQYLDLHDNNITGEIPEFLCLLSSLRILNVRSNSFNGSTPMNLWNLSALQILDFSGNSLNGNIPSSLSKLTGMTDEHDAFSSQPIISDSDFFSVLFNQYYNLEGFRREIPDSIGGLKGLKSLNISINKLSGNIPMSFETLAKLLELTYLDLSNNKLKGRISSGPQMDRMNDPNSYANNTGLCGMQLRVPCDKPSPEPNPTEAETEVEESKNWETWFSWKMAVIGYPSGLLSTILVMYVSGYFNVTPQQGQRLHVGRI